VRAEPYGVQDLHPCALDPDRLVSFEHSSRFGGRKGVAAELVRINTALATAHAHLLECDALFLTLGTAWAFTRAGEVVANCHKQPASIFSRRLVGADEITAALDLALEAAWAVRPELRVVLTISPVRHWKDGPIENSHSKATLVVAAHALAGRHGGGRVGYFPAYELMMDELRDYRFYTADMLHPSDTALEYIFEAFSGAYLGSDALARVHAVQSVRRAAQHRPMDAGSVALSQFAVGQLLEIEKLVGKWGPNVADALAGESQHFERMRK